MLYVGQAYENDARTIVGTTCGARRSPAGKLAAIPRGESLKGAPNWAHTCTAGVHLPLPRRNPLSGFFPAFGNDQGGGVLDRMNVAKC